MDPRTKGSVIGDNRVNAYTLKRWKREIDWNAFPTRIFSIGTPGQDKCLLAPKVSAENSERSNIYAGIQVNVLTRFADYE
jgi:hypothetical protein